MVEDTGKALGAHALRPLGAPHRVTVVAGQHGKPETLLRQGWAAPRRALAVEACWRIDDEWWRERPIARLYFRLRLEDDLMLTVYHDLITDAWFEQRA